MPNELQIEQVGLQWPRYVLKKGDSCFWTGTSWTNRRSEATLFCNDRDAQHVAELIEEYAPREFVVPVRIRLAVREEWTPEIVAQFLQPQVRIDVGDGQSENPDDAVCDLEIEWDLFEEIE